jgi:hypothetical protein
LQETGTWILRKKATGKKTQLTAAADEDVIGDWMVSTEKADVASNATVYKGQRCAKQAAREPFDFSQPTILDPGLPAAIGSESGQRLVSVFSTLRIDFCY